MTNKTNYAKLLKKEDIIRFLTDSAISTHIASNDLSNIKLLGLFSLTNELIEIQVTNKNSHGQEVVIARFSDFMFETANGEFKFNEEWRRFLKRLFGQPYVDAYKKWIVESLSEIK